MIVDEVEYSSQWSREQDKAFEIAIATYDEEDPDRWEKIAGDVEGKAIEEIQVHYEYLFYDVNEIESGRVPVPSYNYVYEDSASLAGEEGTSKKGNINSESGNGGKGSKADQERRKGIAWTEDEHRLFLLGLDKYGKGDWRSISRNFVVTRTPTQVASHAQKYFIRLNSMNKDRRRSSIHDITNVGNADISVPGPITGQSNGSVPGNSSGKTSKQSSQARAVSPGPSMGMYGTPPPAVGTPVNLPAHMAYGVRAPGPGSMVSGAPVNMGPMTYPMPHTTAHR